MQHGDEFPVCDFLHDSSPFYVADVFDTTIHNLQLYFNSNLAQNWGLPVGCTDYWTLSLSGSAVMGGRWLWHFAHIAAPFV